MTLLIFYRFNKRFIGERVAYLALVFLAFSEIHVWYAQEARSYSLFVMVSVLSYFGYFSLLEENNKRGAFLYIVASTAMIYTHVCGGFYYAVQVLVSLLLPSSMNKIRRFLIYMHILVAILYLPWIGIGIDQVTNVTSGYWIPTPDWKSFFHLWISFSGGKAEFIIVAVICLLFSWDIIHIKRCSFQILPRYKIMSLLTWALLPVLLSYIISGLVVPVFLTRTLLPSSVAGISCLALCVDYILQTKYNKLIYALVFGWLILSVYAISDSFVADEKEQWKTLALDLKEDQSQKARVLVHASFCTSAIQYYNPEVELQGFPVDKIEIISPDTNFLDSFVDGREKVCLVYSHSRDEDRLIEDALIRRGYSKVREKSYVGIELLVYRKNKR